MINSKLLLDKAVNYFPAGVNSPVRAFHSVGGNPIFIRKGIGPFLIDVDGNQYIDYVGSWGPLILGHAHPYVVSKVAQAIECGFSYGASTEIEIDLAQKIIEFMPSIEMMRFVNSGTEAAMSAVRLARGYTKRCKIIKFSGCYHGHSDSLLVAAGSGGLTFGVPSSAGVLANTAQETLIADFNNLEQVENYFKTFATDIAAVIVEPIAANVNLILPKPGFLQGLRDLCTRYEALLIFDEVITGFRVSTGGAQAYYAVRPDLTLLGKIIGGGFPAAAYGGRKEIMQAISPLGPVYQAGTLSGNPIAMTAGLATLEMLSEEAVYPNLAAKTKYFTEQLTYLAKQARVPFHAQAIGSMFGLYFTDDDKIENEQDVKNTNVDKFKQFFQAMLQAGIYFAPSAFEIGFISTAHTDAELQQTLQAAEKIFSTL